MRHNWRLLFTTAEFCTKCKMKISHEILVSDICFWRMNGHFDSSREVLLCDHMRTEALVVAWLEYATNRRFGIILIDARDGMI